MKQQISIEYLIIISFSLMVLTPIILFLYDYSSMQEEEYSLMLASESVKKIGEIVDYVYLQGEPSKITIKVTIPKNLEEIKFLNKTIIFKVKTYSGITDIYYNSISEIFGYIPKEEGEYFLTVQAKDKGVYINVSSS
ncbi:MAG: hypothetical protein QXD89_02205 [Candidatus Aenigmatarchaeota archaeon]